MPSTDRLELARTLFSMFAILLNDVLQVIVIHFTTGTRIIACG